MVSMLDDIPFMFVMAKPTVVEYLGQRSGYSYSTELIVSIVNRICGKTYPITGEEIQRIANDHTLNVMGAGFIALLAASQLEATCSGFARIPLRDPLFYKIFYPDHDPSDTSARASAIHRNNAGLVHLDRIKCPHLNSSNRPCFLCFRDIKRLKDTYRRFVLETVPHVSMAGERDNLVHAPENFAELSAQWTYLSDHLVDFMPTD